jgi:hypothetical protein
MRLGLCPAAFLASTPAAQPVSSSASESGITLPTALAPSPAPEIAPTKKIQAHVLRTPSAVKPVEKWQRFHDPCEYPPPQTTLKSRKVKHHRR